MLNTVLFYDEVKMQLLQDEKERSKKASTKP